MDEKAEEQQVLVNLPERPDLFGRKLGLNTDHLAAEMGSFHCIMTYHDFMLNKRRENTRDTQNTWMVLMERVQVGIHINWF